MNVLRFPPQVRLAQPADVPEVNRLLLLAAPENTLPQFPVNFSRAAAAVQNYLYAVASRMAVPPGVVVVIGPVGKRLEAILVMAQTYQWYSIQPYLEVVLTYVDPESRHHGHGQTLVQWVKDHADNAGVAAMWLVLDNEHTQGKLAMYRRITRKLGEQFIIEPA